MMRRPLAGIACCYVAGTLPGLIVPPCPAALLPALLGALLIAWRVADRLARQGRRGARTAACVLVALFVVCAAWIAAALHTSLEFSRLDPVRFRGPATVVGWIDRDPGDAVAAAGGRPASYRLRTELVTLGDGEPVPVAAWLDVAWFGSPSSRAPRYGERWEMSGRLQPAPRSRVRPAPLALSTSGRRATRLGTGQGNRFKARCLQARGGAARYLGAGIEDYPGAVGLVRALVLGYRSQLPSDVRRAFANTGTLHLFAVSGLHVGIIASFIIFVLRSARVPRLYWIFGLAPLLAAYTVATGASASAVRACVMAMAFFLAPLLGRRADPLSSLALAALAILAVEPRQALDPGFVLSFVVVGGLVGVLPVIQRPVSRLWRCDRLRPLPEPPLRRGWRSALRHAGMLACVSVAAWLASAPLTALYFGRFTPAALPGNVIVIPLAFLIVLAGCLSLVLGSCWAWLGVVFNHAVLALAGLLTAVVRGLAALPFAGAELPRPALWGVLLWYILLAEAVLWSRVRQARRTAAETPEHDEDEDLA